MQSSWPSKAQCKVVEPSISAASIKAGTRRVVLDSFCNNHTCRVQALLKMICSQHSVTTSSFMAATCKTMRRMRHLPQYQTGVRSHEPRYHVVVAIPCQSHPCQRTDSGSVATKSATRLSNSSRKVVQLQQVGCSEYAGERAAKRHAAAVQLPLHARLLPQSTKPSNNLGGSCVGTLSLVARMSHETECSLDIGLSSLIH